MYFAETDRAEGKAGNWPSHMTFDSDYRRLGLATTTTKVFEDVFDKWELLFGNLFMVQIYVEHTVFGVSSKVAIRTANWARIA